MFNNIPSRFEEWQNQFNDPDVGNLIKDGVTPPSTTNVTIDDGVVHGVADPLSKIDLSAYSQRPTMKEHTSNGLDIYKQAMGNASNVVSSVPTVPSVNVPNVSHGTIPDNGLKPNQIDTDINKVHPIFKTFLADFQNQVSKDKYLASVIQAKEIRIGEGFRSQKRQNYLYSFGRTKGGKKVTWTRHSRHNSGIAVDMKVPKAIASQVANHKYGLENRYLKLMFKVGAKYGIGGIPKRQNDPYHLQLPWAKSIYKRKG